jgi:hypothetical protein
MHTCVGTEHARILSGNVGVDIYGGAARHYGCAALFLFRLMFVRGKRPFLT